DPSIFRKASAEKLAAADEGETAAHFDIARERKVRGLSVDLGLATAPRAKAYGFPLARWKRMMTEASSVSAAKLAVDGKRLAAKLDTTAKARITAPNGTDLEVALARRRAQVFDGVADEEVGGVNKSSFFFPVTIPNATLEVDGLSLVQNGKVAV